MIFPRKEEVDRIKAQFPAGTEVELIQLKDHFAKIPSGTIGTVISVDDTGTIHCKWDGYGCLGVVYGEDSCRKV